MTNETMKQEIAALEARGWEADTAARGLVWHESFASYDAAVQKLVAIGKAAKVAGVMPAVQIDNGTELTVRVGQAPSPALTPQEIELAKSLTACE